MNKPYVKEYNESGELINEITKNQPYLHRFRSMRGMWGQKYMPDGSKAKVIINKAGQPILVKSGNNRANTSSKKGKHSRN